MNLGAILTRSGWCFETALELNNSLPECDCSTNIARLAYVDHVEMVLMEQV